MSHVIREKLKKYWFGVGVGVVATVMLVSLVFSAPPTLSNFGYEITSEGVLFYVTYTDPDGDIPEYVWVVVNGAKYLMNEADPTDKDVTDGKRYEVLIPFDVLEGTFTYYFQASDGTTVVTTEVLTGNTG